ncbi:hypothetical protein Egran_00695 [Elaphomyces granulatus]|uniref:CBF1-interacting co-repressor CIR N-terminal domain-containing protein n=1 Tax=Elaphomyces granulatus TaxID=519963 RepID=A0A232M568_9EURO|nr:hypothetical protein Egran_00695 [Elaphomyces granulatus]
MPLHLLGKKSWNVYKPENVARVRRDEAQAKALEEETERRMQEADAERRIQILRGQRPSTSPPPTLSAQEQAPSRKDKGYGDDASRHRKRRRLAGENDTDRDIRQAKEDAALVLTKRDELLATSCRSNRDGADNTPIIDSAGHINLFTAEMAHNRRAQKHPEAEPEPGAAKKGRECEEQYTLRFSNAAGLKESASQKPWYSSSVHEVSAFEEMPQKDVWGNEDPMRKDREKSRLSANDPLAGMKRGVRQLKEVERERNKWQKERKRELEMLNIEGGREKDVRKSRQKPSRSRSHEPSDSLEGFSLDTVPEETRQEKERQKKHSPHHHRRKRHHQEDAHGRSVSNEHHLPSRHRDEERRSREHNHSHRSHKSRA